MKSELLQITGVILLLGANNFKKHTTSKELWWAADTAEQAGIALLGANSARKLLTQFGEKTATRKRKRKTKLPP